MQEQEARDGLVRGGYISLAVLAAVGATWLVTGRATHLHEVEATPVGTMAAAADAPTYGQLREGKVSGPAARQVAAFGAMLTRAEGDPEGARNEETAGYTRRRRAQLRAYAGAPPQVPHAVEQRGYPNCTTCHETGMHVEQMAASPMSHNTMANCLQCHVVAQNPLPLEVTLEGEPLLDNSFAPVAQGAYGARAWDGAPPEIPHGTLMRERCVSCHGAADNGIGTTHPWRQSCVQCHARSAEADQEPGARHARAAGRRGE